MIESKPWWWSKTIWMGIAGIISGISQEVGLQMSAEEVAAFGDSLFNVATIVIGMVTIWGRAKADKRIGK